MANYTQKDYLGFNIIAFVIAMCFYILLVIGHGWFFCLMGMLCNAIQAYTCYRIWKLGKLPE